MGADGSLNFDTKIDSSGFSSGIKNLGNIAKSGMTILAGATAGIAGAVGAMAKASLDSVASLEQNVGGVETLFKESADKVIENANRAYKTAGMSANDYMSTVTSFSASLLQSLSGDTKKAAEVSDMAITDMSDNANKMGTSMEMIQNAYQGFAKQNYTMLDNLKLGYGGTKEEMQRLLADAEKISGQKYELSNLSDVYNAIHVIQQELDITGTTSKEAADTIEGSMSSAKAAWDNFLNGTTSAEDMADTVSIAAENIAKNLAEIVPRLAKTVPKLAKGVIEGLAAAFDDQDIADVGLSLVSEISTGVSEKAPVMLEKGTEILSNLLKGISENAPQIIESGAKTLTDFMGGISEKLPELIPLALQAVLSIAQGIVENLPTLIDAGINMLTALAQGIIESLPTLIEKVPFIINSFFEALDQGIFKLIKAGANIIVMLGKGIAENVPLLIANAVEIANAILNIFLHLDIFRAGKSIIKNLVNGIKEFASHPITSVKEIAGSIKNVFSEFSWSDIGSNIINGIVNGVKNAAGNLARAALDAVTGAWDAMTGWLDIHSPSKKAEKVIGKNWALGIGVGFEKNMPVGDMVGNVNTAMSKIHSSVSALEGGANITKRTDSNPVRGGGSSGGPSFEGIDYNRLQRIVNGANSEKTIILNVYGTEVLRWIVSKNDDHSNRTGGDTIFE